MKAISIRQPWASLIASGQKSIETRVWIPRNRDGAPYRGPLLVCAGSALPHADQLGHPDQQLPRGIALCIVDLVDTRPMTQADEAAACCSVYPRAQAWVLRNIRPVEPFSVKGVLGLFEVDVPKIPRQVCGCGEPLSVCDRHTPYRFA